MSLKRLHVVVEGKVQGVFFRACTADEAKRLGLCGWVRNRPDGSVEAEIEGVKRDVERMLAWFQKGSPLSQVRNVIKEYCETQTSEKNFIIRYK